MPDARFFDKPSPITVAELADLTGAKLAGRADGDLVITDVAPLDVAGEKSLSFLDNIKYKPDFLKTKAGACFVHEAHVSEAPDSVTLLVSNHPYKAYALSAQKLYPAECGSAEISEAAHIDSSAEIAKGVTIGPGVVIGPDVKIGAQSWIEAGVVIGRGVQIGAYCRIGPGSTISHAILGDYVRLYPGVRVGQDGFGFAIDPAGHVKVPQLGRVIIEDHVEIGANTTIDRGAGPDTVIGQGTWIDNLVQIGHNVKIGRGCILVSQVGVAGSTVLGDFVALGGQVGVAGHLSVGSGARIAAQSGVMRDIPAGEEHMGSPSMPARQYMRQVATLNGLIKKKKTS